MRRLICLALLVLPGCPEEAADPGPQRDPDPDAAQDAAPEVDASVEDAAGDVAPVEDAAVDLGPDAEAIPPGGQPCTWPADCPFGDCVEGACFNDRPTRCPNDTECPEGEICGGFSNRFYCFTECELEGSCTTRTRVCRSHFECPLHMSCQGGFCINSCVHDGQCAADGYCLEGECRPYPQLFDGAAPTPFGQPGQLYAGVAVGPLDYPVGVSMAGFGGREGPRTPYQEALGGSDRVLEAQDVRVIVLSTDEDMVILLRLPLSWSTDYMMTLTLLELQRLTGVNYDGKLITAATHSHSQPARYWNLVPATGFGIFGYGSFSPEMVQRYTKSFARTIAAALDDMKPARFGHTLVDGFDPDGRIHSDRRGESPHFIDDRLLVWKVEDAEGNPMAGIINFAMHGTHMEETWLTGDAPGGVERVISERLSAREGRDVPVLYINGNAGNVSPRGDDGTRLPWGKMQAVGHRAWNIFEDIWDSTETRVEVEIEMLTRRVPLSYELLGYEEGEFRWADGNPQRYGAFQCVQDSVGPENTHMDGELGCALNIQAFFGAPVPQLHKTTLSALRIDDLVVTTLPGEPTSELGVTVSEQIEADAQAAGQPVRVMNFGYSQDHHLYLLKSDDWFYGGYEAAQGLWGWKLGEYIIGQSRALAGQLFTAEKEDNATGIKPTWWEVLEDDTVMPTPGEGTPGEVLMDAPEALVRGDMFEVTWSGGHPGVDQPDVVLERQEGEEWVEGRKRNGVRYDHGGFESLTIYYGDFEVDHTWGTRWELPFDLPAGTWRLRVRGSGTAGDYDTNSRGFTVSPTTLILRDGAREGGSWTGKLNYPNGPSSDEGQAFESLQMLGHLLRFDGERSFDGALRQWSFLLGPPVLEGLSLSLDGGEAAALAVAEAPVALQLVTARPEMGDEQITQLEGWPSGQVEVPLEAGAHTLRIEDAHGNFAVIEVAE